MSTPLKPLLAALSRIATALEQLTPALTQATRELHQAKMTNDACPDCGGSGTGEVQTPWKTNPCQHCDGKGWTDD